MAALLQRLMPYSQRQKGFIPVNGCLENTLILDPVLSHAKSNLKPVYVVYLDIPKAYDSVNRSSIVRAKRTLGTPGHLCNYLASNRDAACTNVFDRIIGMTWGVKQGDPVSPLEFNAVTEDVASFLDQCLVSDLDLLSLTHCLYAADVFLL